MARHRPVSQHLQEVPAYRRCRAPARQASQPEQARCVRAAACCPATSCRTGTGHCFIAHRDCSPGTRPGHHWYRQRLDSRPGRFRGGSAGLRAQRIDHQGLEASIAQGRLASTANFSAARRAIPLGHSLSTQTSMSLRPGGARATPRKIEIYPPQSDCRIVSVRRSDLNCAVLGGAIHGLM